MAESPLLYNGQTNVQQYDQYEVSISLGRVADCYSALVQLLFGPEQRMRGFRSPGLLRFVTGRNGENGERSRSSRSKSYRCSKCCRRERSRLAL